MSDKHVAIIVPTYIGSESRLKFFKQTVASLARQTRPVVGIIVDDGSEMSDEVKSVVNFYNSKDNLRYVNRLRLKTDLHTASNAINFGLDLVLDKSSGILSSDEKNKLAFASYLHSDDMLPADAIEKRVLAIGSDDFLFSQMLIIDDIGRPINISGDLSSLNHKARGFPHHSSIWTLDFLNAVKKYVSETYEQESVFDPRICFGEDRDVSLSTLETIAKTGSSFKFLPSISYFYRSQDDSITGNASNELILHDHRLIDLKHGFSTGESISSRLLRDLPWSLGAYLPPKIKNYFREPRDAIKRVISHGQFKEYETDTFLNN